MVQNSGTMKSIFKISSAVIIAVFSLFATSCCEDPFTFAQTNVMGTLSLLQAAKAY